MKLAVNYQKQPMMMLSLRLPKARTVKNTPKIITNIPNWLVILAGVFFATSVIATTISVILACKLCSLKEKKNINGMYVAVSAV